MSEPTPGMVAVGNYLHDKRHRARLSLRQIAADTGISISTLSRIENGYCCDFLNGILFADAVGASLDTIADIICEAAVREVQP